MIYSLCITKGVDDYKTRGESPSSVVTLHKTHDDAFDALKDILKNDLVEQKNKYEIAYKLDYVNKTGFKDLFVINEDGYYEFNEDSEINVGDIPKIHDYFCEGEFIPYRWTYEIVGHVNPHD